MIDTIEWPLILGRKLTPSTFHNCRYHYARGKGCWDEKNGVRGGKHFGHDWWAPQGTPIIAPCDGRMRYISSVGDYGHWGKFRSHKTGKGIWIAHCQFRLEVRDYKRGEVMGFVGTTGTNSTGPHLHSELHPEWDNFHSVEDPWTELNRAIDRWRRDQEVRVEHREQEVIVYMANRCDIFYRGPQGTLMHKWWDGTSFYLEDLGGLIAKGTQPSVAAKPGQLNVHIKGVDPDISDDDPEEGYLWQLAWTAGQGWKPWEQIGTDEMGSGPASVWWDDTL